MSEERTAYNRTPPDFDEVTHTYALRGVRLPSVTEIIKAVLPVQYHGATEWHMDRGTVVHQCAAMICRGIRFTHDPQIDGQVQAVKTWLAMRKPEIVSVERLVWRDGPIPYAGTLDGLVMLQGRLWLIDWKGSQSPWDQWQLGGYADALAHEGIEVKHGMTVLISEDGKPKESKPVDLRRARNEWKSLLNVYQMMKREGIQDAR